MFKALKAFFKDEEGQGMVEYGLIIALIAIVVIVALGSMGESISGIFDRSSGVLDQQAGGAEAGEKTT